MGEIIPRMLTTVLKYLAWSFTSEALETKLQILNTTVKVYLLVPELCFKIAVVGFPCFMFETSFKVYHMQIKISICDLFFFHSLYNILVTLL